MVRVPPLVHLRLTLSIFQGPKVKDSLARAPDMRLRLVTGTVTAWSAMSGGTCICAGVQAEARTARQKGEARLCHACSLPEIAKMGIADGVPSLDVQTLRQGRTKLAQIPDMTSMSWRVPTHRMRLRSPVLCR